jgi:ribonuclease T2
MSGNPRWVRGARGRLSALLGLIALLCSGGAVARHHNRPSAGTPGDFAYYVLSLSWSPAFCLSAPSSPECSGTRRYGLIVHGLWPQYERGWPEHCDADRRVPEDVVSGILDLMPARPLIYHEWSTHGTCSGLAPGEFFAQVRRAYSQLKLPPLLAKPVDAVETSPGALAQEFIRANPRLSSRSLLVTCSGQELSRLREIRVCLDRDLAPRDCSPDALRGACRAAQVMIPPVR